MSERYLPSFPGDWPEDFPHENGNYQNQCSDCGHAFIGHKRRITCKLCSNPMTNQPASDTERAECNLHAALDALKDGNFESATKLAESAIRIMNNPGCGNQSEPEPPKGTCAEHRQTALELDPLCPICLLRNNNQLQAELTRLSAERSIHNALMLEGSEKIDELRAALAERDRKLAEAEIKLESARTHCQLRSAGHDDLRTRLNRLSAEHLESLRHLEEKDKRENELIAQLADSQRQKAETERALVMATDAANKGDEARCKAGAMQDMIDDLKRQKAELEGRLTWQPIETAPKGYPALENPSEWFLACGSKYAGPKGFNMAVIRRCFGHGFGPWEGTGDEYYKADFFTHWMPLPDTQSLRQFELNKWIAESAKLKRE